MWQSQASNQILYSINVGESIIPPTLFVLFLSDFKIHLNLNQICWPHVSSACVQKFQGYNLLPDIGDIYSLHFFWKLIFIIIFDMKWKCEIFNTKLLKLCGFKVFTLSNGWAGTNRTTSWMNFTTERVMCSNIERDCYIFFIPSFTTCIFHQLQCCKYMYPLL